MKRVGFTTGIPLEIILAAGKVPVDINLATKWALWQETA